MPSTRRRRSRTPSTLTLRALGLEAELDLLVGWHPPTNAFERQRSRWRTYRGLLDDYRQVRDELLACRTIQPGDFAETFYQRVAADRRGDVEAIGAAVYRAKYPASGHTARLAATPGASDPADDADSEDDSAAPDGPLEGTE
jgi:hypothetical protein